MLRGDGTLCLSDFGGIVLARAALRQGLRLSDGIHLAPEVRQLKRFELVVRWRRSGYARGW